MEKEVVNEKETEARNTVSITIKGNWKNIPRDEKILSLIGRLIPIFLIIAYLIVRYFLQYLFGIRVYWKYEAAYIGIVCYIILMLMITKCWEIFLHEEIRVIGPRIQHIVPTKKREIMFTEVERITKYSADDSYSIAFKKRYGFHQNLGFIHVTSKYKSSDRKRLLEILENFCEEYGYNIVPNEETKRKS